VVVVEEEGAVGVLELEGAAPGRGLDSEDDVVAAVRRVMRRDLRDLSS
jgi:hypothetical protein